MKNGHLKSFFLICTAMAIIFAFSITAIFSISLSQNPLEKFDITKISERSLISNIYDNKNRLVDYSHSEVQGYVELSELPTYVKECFISIEDKNFYQHNGINYKRMIKAGINNLKSFSLKEGASTISQQLIKNTHLTSEKTFRRKINEIVLSKQMEKILTKDQILEAYLNIIYFGDNCYGIEDASKHYFNKSAKDLTLNESATLAGVIKSPSKFHPVKNKQKCLARRNLVLSELKKDGKILDDEYEKNKNLGIEINLKDNLKNINTYQYSVLLEASKILDMPIKQILIGKYRIYSYMDLEKQKHLEQVTNNLTDNNYCCVSISPETGHVEAYYGSSALCLYNVKRQPASCIKPILVYAPALNDNIITPLTQILDEEINLNGYTPKNVGNKYYGYVDIKTAVSKSLNVPAIKVCCYVGLDRCKFYAQKCGIEFGKNDDNLSVALGGLSDGVTLCQLGGAYTALFDGYYKKPQFISHIVDNKGKVIYKNNQQSQFVFRDDTAFLITDILQQTTKNGTAKKLNSLPYVVASKTGTNAVNGKNIDAYNISYTTNDLFACWVGNINNQEITTVGGGTPTDITKNYFEKIYQNSYPANFIPPSSVCEKEVDCLELEQNKVVKLANDFVPDRYKIKQYFSKFNMPKLGTNSFITLNPIKISGHANGNNAIIEFVAEKDKIYDIYCDDKKVYSVEYKNGKQIYEYTIKNKKYANFYVITKMINYSNGQSITSPKSNELNLCFEC